MKTDIKSGKEAREAIIRGVNKMANPVASTLGPRGKNVMIAKHVPTGEIYERTTIHDGVTVARNIQLEDEAENTAAQILKEASQKQVDEVGDGTTVVMILAQAIINQCMELVAAGTNPMSLRAGLENASEGLVRELEEMAIPVKDKKELMFVATNSAEDKELGELISNAFDKLGVDGVVTAEESKSSETTLEIQEGMQLDKGYLNSWFITNPEREEAVLENCYFLITDIPITTLGEMSDFLAEFLKMSKNLVIISPDISGEAVPLLLLNRQKGVLFPLAIQAPSFGEDQKAILHDIAVLTGGRFFSQELGCKLKDLTIDDLGFSESITSTKDETIIVKGKGTKKEVDRRILAIKKSIEGLAGGEKSDFDKERLKARLGKLTRGIGIIRVGGQTEIEMKERRERVLDSIGATRAAMEKGIVAGGEIVYLHIRKSFMPSKEANVEMDNSGNTTVRGIGGSRNLLDLSITERILYNALYEPFKKLITNADLSEIDMALALSGKGKNFGVDVTTGEIKDLIKAGIIDPVLVPMNAIKNAVSVAIQILTSGYIITPKIEKKEK